MCLQWFADPDKSRPLISLFFWRLMGNGDAQHVFDAALLLSFLSVLPILPVFHVVFSICPTPIILIPYSTPSVHLPLFIMYLV